MYNKKVYTKSKVEFCVCLLADECVLSNGCFMIFILFELRINSLIGGWNTGVVE